ncbi:TVP38/TMEM64 family protein [Cryomorpha ignava]|uniref:TVP38/TMEM64 family protein n=1 Tax=Cryomorpha ignava TaxID=101383 RepID=UPI001953FC54|nr:TVP38/TMEM64 family protein [Cryomorpha ignava]
MLLSDDEADIKRWVGELGFWGPLFIIVAMVVQMFLIFVPSPLLMVVAVLAYGPVLGTILAIVSVMISSTIGYFVGRMIGEEALYRLIGKSKEDKMESYVSQYGLWVVIISRVSPVFSNDAISFVAGILNMKFLKFIGATFVGITPLAILIGWFGENNDRLRTGLIWTSVICVVLLVAYIIFDRRRNKKLQME